MDLSALSLDLVTLRAAYREKRTTPAAVLAEVQRRIEAHGDPAVWIHRLSEAEISAHVARVTQRGWEHQPLYGVPFAIKDNLDLAGAPTTAACPEFAYTPATSAFVVQRLLDAGAIPVGKTNLDQFATGLVGVRSPYGTPRNPFHPEMIPGGSSSGSAVATAAGLVSFALGTDTAGSGRVPASFNNLVGLKPTRGWFSTRGLVPACRSLDCVSVFALTVNDAAAVAAIAGAYDDDDPFARKPAVAFDPASTAQEPPPFRFGVPQAGQLDWLGDAQHPPLFALALERLKALGGQPVEIDFTPFAAAARLLYEGPWLAERWAAVRSFHAAHAASMFPVTRTIIERGSAPTAADAFESGYRLRQLQREAEKTWAQVDLLLLPTTATAYTRAEVAAEPLRLNAQLGLYTNFANLLDTAALAVPVGFRSDGLPFGVTLFGPAWTDARLARIGRALHARAALPLGATRASLPDTGAPLPTPLDERLPAGWLPLAVVGAHLSGQPLNGQLTSRGGRLWRKDRTAAAYRLFVLPQTSPVKPGLQRVPTGEGVSIEVEIWLLPAPAWAEFVAAVPLPHAIGQLQLIDGSSVPGYLCEPLALNGATDISRFGGWRRYRTAVSQGEIVA